MTDGNTYAINKHLNGTLQELTAEIEQAEARIEELEAKLAKAVEVLRNVVEEYDWFREDEYERGMAPLDDKIHYARTALAELKGQE